MPDPEELERSPPAPNDEDTVDDRALEIRLLHAHSLAETLLLALGIPFDQHADETEPTHFTIEPPITAAKVAAQIAQVTNALLAGTIAADQARVILFALQTMLTAIRVNAIEQKADRQRTTKPAARARRERIIMQSYQAPKNSLIAFPAEEEIALTPALWLACGVVAYNFALLARCPMRILAAREIPSITDVRAESVRRGLSTAIDATPLLPSVRSATLQICRTLLAPLHFAITFHPRAKRPYLLIEYLGGLELPLPDREDTIAEITTARVPTTAPIHPAGAVSA